MRLVPILTILPYIPQYAAMTSWGVTCDQLMEQEISVRFPGGSAQARLKSRQL